MPKKGITLKRLQALGFEEIPGYSSPTLYRSRKMMGDYPYFVGIDWKAAQPEWGFYSDGVLGYEAYKITKLRDISHLHREIRRFGPPPGKFPPQIRKRSTITSCANKKCLRFSELREGNCFAYNSIGRRHCHLRINPDMVACKDCGRSGAKAWVVRTVAGWLCRHCRGSISGHISLIRRLGGIPTYNGQVVRGGKLT